MSYQVLARKWRPRNFAEMVGQTHVLRALINALDADRLHHAFLFTGTRGVGKTTIARILAKSLNCEQGVSSTPCGECAACREIDEGRFVDLIEVDAASRTKVEDTRDLLDNVQYAPTRGRYKVYLIDEVHMLSNHSFNALLKTLEEPPPHVKFLLATTDPQKLPVTILSRCLQFNLRRLPSEQIQDYLQDILRREGLNFEAAGLSQLAKAADGSMRDALSLLDQAIAFGGGQVSEADVRAMLGTIDRSQVLSLLSALADGQAKTVLEVVGQLAEQAPDFADILAELISHLHYLALLQQVPEAYDESMGDKASLESLAQQIAPEDVQLYYQIGLMGRRDLPLAPDPRGGLEMVLLRMLAFRPEGMMPASQASPQGRSKSAPPPPPVEQQAAPQKPAVESQAVKTAATAPADKATPASAPVSDDTDWHQLIPQLSLGGVDQQLIMNCVLLERQDDKFKLALEPACGPMLTREREQRIQDALSQAYGRPLRISIEVQSVESETPAARQERIAAEKQADAESAIENDGNVQSILEAFNGTVKPNSVQVVEE
ncbi:MAG: DNA polymerase III subunit gamma/tau [Thioalkalispiraceae bacterium]